MWKIRGTKYIVRLIFSNVSVYTLLLDLALGLLSSFDVFSLWISPLKDFCYSNVFNCVTAMYTIPMP